MSERVALYNKAKRFDDVCTALEMEFGARREAEGMQDQRTLLVMRTLGRSYARVGRHEDALALYRQSLADLPSTPDDADASSSALFTVGWLLTRDMDEIQDPGRAVEFARRAVDMAQAENARALYKMLDVLALAQHRSGDAAGAIDTQKRAIEAIPKRAGRGVVAKYERHLSTYQAAMNPE